jgi:hypothetical protein
MTNSELNKALENTLKEIEGLKQRIKKIEETTSETQKCPRTNLLNENFLTRAFTVWGHNFVAGIIISIPFWILGMVIAIMLGAFRY